MLKEVAKIYAPHIRMFGIARLADPLRQGHTVHVTAGTTWCECATHGYARRWSAELAALGISHTYEIKFKSPGWLMVFRPVEEQE